MELTKGLLQGTIVIVWAVYAVALILSPGGGDGASDPTAGTALLEGFLETLPGDALVVSTVVMLAALVVLEVVFFAVRRARPR